MIQSNEDEAINKKLLVEPGKRVACSCGRTNVASYDVSEKSVLCLGWEFRKYSGGELLLGWYCG